ncbi:ninjurin-1-like [Mya arenaria]|uniref:ninjurin-1-like n=1 Tax=Mya arenaria TaxID=6604 RepID=UPI0022E3322B|nr:ninjurin-1-like [Mya arenaria]
MPSFQQLDEDCTSVEMEARSRTNDHPDKDEPDTSFKDISDHPNMYVGKRNFIHQLMDVALVMANVSQLKSLLSINDKDKYFYALLVFILLSITLQVIFTVCMLIIWSIEKKLDEHAQDTSPAAHVNDRRNRIISERLDKIGNILVLLVIVSNVFVTGFGVEPHLKDGEDNFGLETVTPTPPPGER